MNIIIYEYYNGGPKLYGWTATVLPCQPHCYTVTESLQPQSFARQAVLDKFKAVTVYKGNWYE